MTCPHCGHDIAPGTRLCPECGRPLLVPLASRRYALTDAEGRRFPLPDGISRIGRDPATNEIVLTDPSVSSRHAAIEVSPRAIVLRDLGSANGTGINGQRLTQASLLQEGDRVSFGRRELRLARDSDDQPRIPRGIPTPIAAPTRGRVAESGESTNLTAALATIALTLLAILLHTVAIADGIQRDDLPLSLPLVILGLVIVPLIAIVLIAFGRTSGYLVAAIAGVFGLLFVTTSGTVFAGGMFRDELIDEYGSTGFRFIRAASVLAL
ncbi:MAG TPA: FHA domain-containing protein, partial [Thermomicrobiales bacterium]|nr:FHA domain-containing protein [Thermomicrobiales bacterium]